MRVTDIAGYVNAVTSLSNDSGFTWFRGIRRHRYSLVPSLYRVGNPAWTEDDYFDLEERLVDRFAERSLPYRTREPPREKIGLLFEMQHYGAPTRLLDWSENALVALWFALEVPSTNRTRVWCLNPSLWNSGVVPSRRDVNATLSPTDDTVGGLLTWQQPRRNAILNNPLCIFGMHNSTRIVGQRGVFTLSGRSRVPMERQVKDIAAAGGRSPSELLVAIDVPAYAQASLRNSLAQLGFSRSMIYPDLVGLAQELTEQARAGRL